jgi:hypothetical protein
MVMKEMPRAQTRSKRRAEGKDNAHILQTKLTGFVDDLKGCEGSSLTPSL